MSRRGACYDLGGALLRHLPGLKAGRDVLALVIRRGIGLDLGGRRGRKRIGYTGSLLSAARCAETFAANEKVIFPFVVEAIVVAGCP